MNIGNGFFTDTEDQAIQEMRQRSHCNVRYLPFPTSGNVTYYISEQGHIYGLQHIANRCITRTKQPSRNAKRLCARLSVAPHKERWVPMEQVVWNAFHNHQWAEQPLIHIDGNPDNYRLTNLRLAKRLIPDEWPQRMADLQNVYAQQFSDVVEYTHCNVPDVPVDDAKDIAQSTFIYLTTDGYKQHNTEHNFIGLWKKVSRLRAIDFLTHRFMNQYDPLALEHLRTDRHTDLYETDLTQLLPGERSKQYLRLWMQGNTTQEIAQQTDSTPSTVRSSNTRSIQFLRKYIRQYGQLSII